jgi:ribokinase
MRFLTYGSLNIDLIFAVDHIAQEGETLQSISLTKSAGGKGANQAAALAKAGSKVYHAGKIGDDGRFLLELLGGWGVDTSAVRLYDGPTGQALIQVDREGRNAILLYGGGNKEITIDEIDETLSDFGEGDMLVLQNEIVHTAHLITKARQRGMAVALNAAPFDETILDLPLEELTLLIVNELEGAALARMEGSDDFHAILDALTKAYPSVEILLTVGSGGSYWAYEQRVLHQPIYPATVVDTTAAGDTFIGYYLSSIARGYPVEEALRYATKAASLTVSRSGAMASIPHAAEIFG